MNDSDCVPCKFGCQTKMMISEGSYDWEEADLRSESPGKKDSLNLNSLDCWDYTIELECLQGTEDLQLAAELGKNLLARNKELENSVKQFQSIIEEQAQEIEYLSKQTTALRKTNDNRIKIYEQLEVSIQELERANQRLAVDNTADKKQIKSLSTYCDTLEARCEELQKSLDEARNQEKAHREKSKNASAEEPQVTSTEEPEAGDAASPRSGKASDDVATELRSQIQELKRQKSRNQRKIIDLEEKICRISHDKALLEEELSTLYQREEYVKNLEEEISALEDVRSGSLCGRCMREMDPKLEQVQIMLDPEEEEGETSAYSGKNSDGNQPETKEENPYRKLVEKYEALLEEQQKNRRYSRESGAYNCLSLQDELKPFGDFNSIHGDDERDEESGREEERKCAKRKVDKRKTFSTTPTDFSEAETTSSGFSDETSNKATQTDRNPPPGSFLCSIKDGEDCKLSIYDDACPIESRFRKTPEYRTLFREIFAVLKRAAEAKDVGEPLPLLDDLTPTCEVPKVPPATPSHEEAAPLGADDLKSLPDSVGISEAATEDSQDPKTESSKASDATQETGQSSSSRLSDYYAFGLTGEKKERRRTKNAQGKKTKARDQGPEQQGTPRNSPRRSGGRKRKEWRNYDSPMSGSRTQSPVVRPHVLTTLEQKQTPPEQQQKGGNNWGFQPFVSTAAQEIAKLKKLEKSYAEALKGTPKNFKRTTRKGGPNFS